MTTEQLSDCRAERVVSHTWMPLGARPWLASLPAIIFGAATYLFVSHSSGAAPLKGVVLFTLAVALLAVVVGCAAIAGAFFAYWLRGILDLLSERPGRGRFKCASR